MVPVTIPARFDDTAAEQPTGDQQRHHRDEFGAHDIWFSVMMLVIIDLRRSLAAILPATMFLQMPMLRRPFTLPLPFTRLLTVFLTAGTTIIPVGLLNAV
jgi:hypothetical protein